MSASPCTRSAGHALPCSKPSQDFGGNGRASRCGLSSKYSETRPRSLDPPGRILQTQTGLKPRFAGRPKTCGLLAFRRAAARATRATGLRTRKTLAGAFAGEPAQKIPSASSGSISRPLADPLKNFRQSQNAASGIRLIASCKFLPQGSLPPPIAESQNAILFVSSPPSFHFTIRSRSFQPPKAPRCSAFFPVEGVPPRSLNLDFGCHSKSAGVSRTPRVKVELYQPTKNFNVIHQRL